jgi:ATP-binding cassette, subfamily G (WHITE), eye pigment precursor transporter
MKLTKCQGTHIGGPLVKGISGGERKRTSVGVELITDPSLIFLDEPTTGLDSFIATQVMENLRDLALVHGKTVVSTIHQPNSDIFDMFDKLMLLAKGKVIYFNDASHSVKYFTDIGRPCPELTNPADYFMTIMSIEGLDAEELMKETEYQGKERDEVLEEEYAAMIQYYDEEY